MQPMMEVIFYLPPTVMPSRMVWTREGEGQVILQGRHIETASAKSFLAMKMALRLSGFGYCLMEPAGLLKCLFNTKLPS